MFIGHARCAKTTNAAFGPVLRKSPSRLKVLKKKKNVWNHLSEPEATTGEEQHPSQVGSPGRHGDARRRHRWQRRIARDDQRTSRKRQRRNDARCSFAERCRTTLSRTFQILFPPPNASALFLILFFYQRRKANGSWVPRARPRLRWPYGISSRRAPAGGNSWPRRGHGERSPPWRSVQRYSCRTRRVNSPRNVRLSAQPSLCAHWRTGRGGLRGRGGFAGRRGRGRGVGRPSVTREQLDNQLDAYMSKTKGHLDAELDAYMAQANPESME